MIRALLLLAIVTQALAQSPAPLPVPSITILPPDEDRPTACERCDMPWPIKPFKQWEDNHRFAHHLVEVLLRMEGRRMMTDNKTELRQLLKDFRLGVDQIRWATPNSAALALLDKSGGIIETLVLRVERLEGEISRKNKQEAKK